MDSITVTQEEVYAPLMVINPGETPQKAMARHRRDTGYQGHIVVVGWNTGKPTRPHAYPRPLSAAFA